MQTRGPGPLREFYLRLKRTKGDNKVIVAVAHRMLRIMHAMIVHGRDYDHALDGNVRKKALEMRRKAQRARRPSAVAMTVAQLSSEIPERIRREGSVSLDSRAFIREI